jgi:hypothetical protein
MYADDVMLAMSRAINAELEKVAPRLSEMPTEVLDRLRLILGAFYFDVKGEWEKREDRVDARAAR